MSSIAESRRRYEHARASKAEFELKKRKGELVEMAEVNREWGGKLSQLKQRLLAIPSRAAPAVMVAGDIVKVRAILDEMIREAMRPART